MCETAQICVGQHKEQKSVPNQIPTVDRITSSNTEELGVLLSFNTDTKETHGTAFICAIMCQSDAESQPVHLLLLHVSRSKALQRELN